MLSEIQKKQFTPRAKGEAANLLKELGITVLNEDSLCNLQEELDLKVASLVTKKECEGQEIDDELLEIYDLLTDIILDNEEDLDFLNSLFFD